MARPKNTEVVPETIAQGAEIPLSEIGNSAVIEPVAEDMSFDAIELDAFMNEYLTINVFPDNRPDALEVISPNVNGINQPIIRGVNSKVRRKYVEALARSKEETFVQKQNLAEPDKRALVPTTVPSYSFAVIADPNPKGPAWLKGILREV